MQQLMTNKTLKSYSELEKMSFEELREFPDDWKDNYQQEKWQDVLVANKVDLCRDTVKLRDKKDKREQAFILFEEITEEERETIKDWLENSETYDTLPKAVFKALKESAGNVLNRLSIRFIHAYIYDLLEGKCEPFKQYPASYNNAKELNQKETTDYLDAFIKFHLQYGNL